MSALGQKQTLTLRSDDARFTSKADFEAKQTDVRFGPKANIQLCSLSHAHMRQKGGRSAASGTSVRVRRRRKPIEIASMSSIMVCHIAHHPALGKVMRNAEP
jgi:hypothetical protein